MAHVVGHLLHGLGRDLGQPRIRRLLQRLQIGMHERRVEQMPHHGGGEIAVGLLDQQHVGERVLIAQVGKVVLAAPLPSTSPA
jgi:hypothetical protein